MRTSLSLLVLAWLLAAGCGGTVPGSTSTTAYDTCVSSPDAGGPKPGFGERCDPQVGCATGLSCQDSEFAAFPWCTRACTDVDDHCDDTGLGGRKGFCVQMPAGWRGPSEPFCAPECGKKSDCLAIDGGWETCEKVEYKGKQLSSLGYVCEAPSAHGAPHVDPGTCDFQAQFPEPKFAEAKGVAKAYCQFLATCQLRGVCTSAACCTWRAFQYLLPAGKDGPVDNGRIADLKCFPQALASFQQTPQACTAWQDECKPLPVQ